jgi:hypothetical protein
MFVYVETKRLVEFLLLAFQFFHLQFLHLQPLLLKLLQLLPFLDQGLGLLLDTMFGLQIIVLLELLLQSRHVGFQ